MNQKDLEQVLHRLHNIKKFKMRRHFKLRKLIRSVGKDQELKRFAPQSFKKSKSDVGTVGDAGHDTTMSEDDVYSDRIRNLTRLKDIIEVELKRLKDKIRVTRYIYEVSLLTPWVLTSSFIKNHIEVQSKTAGGLKNLVVGGMMGGNRAQHQKYSGLLRLTGIPGDPSGVGEGYSYLASVSTKKPAPKKDKGDTNAASSTATIVGTGKDLRVLTMKDLEVLCLELGATREEVKILKRWDRVKYVEIAATKAKKMGVAKHLWRYARDEGEGVQNLEEYKETCIDIWNRQVVALRDISWEDADAIEGQAKEDCLRRLHRKQRRERKAEQVARREERAQKLEQREARAVARAAGEDIPDSDEEAEMDVDDDVNGDDDMSLEDSDSSSGDSESESDLSDDLNSEDDDDDDDDDDAVTSDDPIPVAAVASQRTKRALLLAKQLQSQEEKDLKYFENLNKDNSSKTVGGGGGGNEMKSPVEEPVYQPKSRAEHERFWSEIKKRGGKVVKRVTRRVLDDGTEKIEVRFVVDENEVDRVLENERIAGIREHRLQQQREDDIAMGRTPRRSTGGNLRAYDEYDSLFDSGQKKSRKSLDHDNYEDEIDGETSALTLKVGSYKNKAERYSNKIARERDAEDAMYERDFGASTKRARGNARQSRGSAYIGRCAGQQRNLRLPHILLASNLETVWHSMYVKKDAHWFRQPVDLVVNSTYTQFVKQPISLQEIHEKITSFSYHTVNEFVKDLKLIESNSVAFNTLNHPVTQLAKKLVASALQLLAAEGGSTLDNQDSFGFSCQENDIKSTFTRMGRVININSVEEETSISKPSVPDVINPNAIDTASVVTSSMSTEPGINPSLDTSSLIPRRAAPNDATTSSISQPPLQRHVSLEPGEIVQSSDPPSTN